MKLVDSTAVVRSAESTAEGGVKSLEPDCPGQFGPQGPAVTGPGTIVPLPGFARHLRANAPVRSGETHFGRSVESLTLYAQSAFLDATPRVWLGAGTSLVLLAAEI